MFWIKCFIVAVGFCGTAADYARYAEFVTQQAENETFVRLFEEHLKQFQDQYHGLRASESFPCKTYPPPATKSVSVHQLSPMDIKVVAALGDSITAGTGITASTVIGLLREDRGKSWSIGGDKSIDEEETLPNMLRLYSPDTRGFSTGSGPVWWEPTSQLNLANPGDTSENIPSQARTLVERMKNNKDINFDEDWKVITLFIGGNDLCDFCEDEEKYKAENYVAHIQEALDHLHANVPRAFVNLVEILDISIVKKLNQNFVCDTLHLFLCSCAAFPSSSDKEAELQAETKRYRELTNQLVLTGRYDTKDDFTVVVQPFFSQTLPPPKPDSDDPDLSYFAPDCFHLSLKGHRAAADALWNNMVEPVGKKRKMWTPHELVECPTEKAPFFYTYKNSGDRSNLGSEYSADNMDSNRDNKPDNKVDTNSGTVTVIAAVGGVLVLMAVVVFGAVAARRRHTYREEREILLISSAPKPSYVQI